MNYVRLPFVIVMACIAGAFPSRAQNSDPAQKHDACFFSNQFENWRAPDDRTLLIRVGLKRYYRLDLSASCPGITWPDAHLINHIRGSDVICRPIDWDLKVGQSVGGFAQACIVKSMTMLSPAEVESIPRQLKP